MHYFSYLESNSEVKVLESYYSSKTFRGKSYLTSFSFSYPWEFHGLWLHKSILFLSLRSWPSSFQNVSLLYQNSSLLDYWPNLLPYHLNLTAVFTITVYPILGYGGLGISAYLLGRGGTSSREFRFVYFTGVLTLTFTCLCAHLCVSNFIFFNCRKSPCLDLSIR